MKANTSRRDFMKVAGATGLAVSFANTGVSFELNRPPLQEIENPMCRLKPFRAPKRAVKEAVPGFLWIDAGQFDSYGGWELDTFFTDLAAASGYLLANRFIGPPVDDAVTSINIPEGGTWYLWVRARNGCRVALIHDRPVLGGNARLELMVPPNGAARHETFDRETGIIEEIRCEGCIHSPRKDHGKVSCAMEFVVANERNITLFLNENADNVTASGNRIRSVESHNTLTGARSVYRGETFIDNLLFAGRNGSFSAVALGAVRVEVTCATMGQAVKTAATLCRKHGCTPRDIYKRHLKELQQQLLKDDQYIIGLVNEDPAGRALSAKANASSSAAPENGPEKINNETNKHNE